MLASGIHLYCVHGAIDLDEDHLLPCYVLPPKSIPTFVPFLFLNSAKFDTPRNSQLRVVCSSLQASLLCSSAILVSPTHSTRPYIRL